MYDHHTASGYFRTGNQYVYSKLIKIMNLRKRGAFCTLFLLKIKEASLMTPIKTPFGGTLEFYPLPDTSGKGTVLICPGGGYSFLAEREGRPIADAFTLLPF